MKKMITQKKQKLAPKTSLGPLHILACLPFDAWKRRMGFSIAIASRHVERSIWFAFLGCHFFLVIMIRIIN